MTASDYMAEMVRESNAYWRDLSERAEVTDGVGTSEWHEAHYGRGRTCVLWRGNGSGGPWTYREFSHGATFLQHPTNELHYRPDRQGD